MLMGEDMRTGRHGNRVDAPCSGVKSAGTSISIEFELHDLPISTLAKYFSPRQPTRSNFEMSSESFEAHCLRTGGTVHLPQSRSSAQQPNQAPLAPNRKGVTCNGE
jgi:hypothetical protein